MITLPVYNTEGKEIEKIRLDETVFGGAVNNAVIYQVVCAYRANQRKGLAVTKTRGEVSGGGRKPWRQKGTGRARVGSIRSPLWRHGGVIFGPQRRDFSYTLPKRLKTLALKSALCARIKENNFMVLDGLKLEGPKTKEVVKVLSHLQIASKKGVLLLLDKMNENTKLAIRNIDFLTVNLAKDTHAYEVLTARKVIISKDGLKQLTERLKK